MKATKFPKAVFLVVIAGFALVSVTLAAADETSVIAAAPAPAASNTLKINYVSPTAQVEKLVSAGIPEDVIKAYVVNYPGAFNLTSDNIIQLQSTGVSGAVLTEMLNHDKALRDAANAMPPQSAPPSAYPQPQPGDQTAMYPTNPQSSATYTTDTPDYSAQNYTYLAGYGNWYYDNGYGWCWQGYPGLGYAYYPWGLLGYGNWRYWGNRGWCWYPNSGFFHTWNRGGNFAGNRFGGGFNRGFSGNRSFSGFSGARGGFSPSVIHSGGGVSHFGGGGRVGGFGGGGHTGGFGGGGHGGGGGGHR
jgi:hypothetical protein